MEGEIKNFEELVKLMPMGWEQMAREMGALTRSGEIKDAKDLFPVNFLCLTSTPSFGKTAAVSRLEGSIHLNKNTVYERIMKSGPWFNQLWQGERAGNFECFGAGDVVIGDRACGTIQGIEYLRGRGSGFVFRLRAQAFTVYTVEGDKTDLAGYFEGLGEGETGEVTVYYKAGDEYRPVRICARRKSEEEERQGRERMEKTNRRKGTGEVSESQEAYNRYIIVAASLDGAA